ncbi:MAG TPA: protein kinase [Candidatus Limnocylindria bacterium]|nr:protein kinase [Candidatus Limnocylindria bacterium]
MTPAEPGLPALLSVVAEALDLPSDARAAHLDASCPDPAQRAEAGRLLRACEKAAASPIFDLGAAHLAAAMVAEVDEDERALPEALVAALAGRYTIESELGRGGMATVYLARDERHGRLVALKLLRPELVPDDGPSLAAARFQREIEFAARLSHPHILPLFDSGEAAGLLYYITPYVDGETLRERLRRTGRLPLAETLRLLREVARALAYAHGHGVVHRDIKPPNILLNKEGHALVADFGVAKGLAAVQGAAGAPQAELTEGTLALGTPAYMAPEQVTGGPGVDHHADLYAFGALAYELLTGAPPFAGRPRHEQLAAHLSELPEPVAVRQPDVPEALVDLVQRLLAKRPEDRPGDASEVLQVLDAVQAGRAAPARRGRHVRWRASIGGAALLAVSAVAVLVFGRVAEGAAPVSIAVLPFDVLGDGTDTDYLAVGLSDAIGTDLGRSRRIVTPGYLTTSAYRESAKSLAQIGSELQVGAVLRGSVQRLDGRVRVDARLLDPETGGPLWAQVYERPATDLLEVQRDIVRAVLAELGIRPTADEREALDRAASANGRAYDLYLRARAIELAGESRELRRPVPADIIRRAQGLYAQARDLDPGFAAARARLALMHTLAAATYDTTEARREHARLEAEAALRLRPGLPEAHEALASYWSLEGNAARAAEELGLALEGFPNSADLHLALGSAFSDAGRLEDALAASEEAMRLDPGSAKAPFQAAVFYGRLRRREEAMRALDRAIAIAPDFHLVRVIKGHSYLRWKGIPDTLAAALRSVPADWDPDGMATFSRFTALWVQGRNADALAMLDGSRSEISHDAHIYQPVSLMRARLLEGLGERELARASYATARAILQDSVEAHPSAQVIRISLAMAYAGLGQSAEALREARRALELARVGSRTVGATAIMGWAVEVFAMAGEFDDAFDMIELLLSMPAGREITIPFLRVWPGFDPLRDDPRFVELLERPEAADQIAASRAP